MRVVWVGVLCVLMVGVGFAAEERATLDIFAETQSMKMIGMPDMAELMAGLDPSLLANIPGMANLPMMGPKRLLDVSLRSPGVAPENGAAALGVPNGLGLGPTLNLEIVRPEPVTPGEGAQPASTDFTVKYYWGSSPTVKPGQPEVLQMGALTPEQRQAMEAAQAAMARGGAGLKAGDNWTWAHWPTATEPGIIGKDAALPGHYALATNYTGGATVDMPAEMNFLGAIELTSPPLTESPPLDAAIVFAWKPVKGALGYHAQIVGMEGEKVLIVWISSELGPKGGMGWEFLTPKQIAELVESGALIGPDRKEVTVPAGIFQGCQNVFLMMTGYGMGVRGEGETVQPRAQTKTTLMIPLMGGMMPEGEGGPAGEGG